MARLWERLARPGPVSAMRLAQDLGWSASRLEDVLREAARQKVLEIAGRKALAKGKLANEAGREFRRCYSGRKVEKLISGLVREGALRRAVALVGRSTLYFRAGAVEPLVSAFWDKLRALGFEETAPPRALPAPAGTDLPALLLEKVRDFEEAPGIPVTVHRLRAAFPNVSKDEFDRAVLALAERQSVFLTRHSHGWALPEAERGKLVHDGGTNLYVGITLRQ